MSFKVMIYACFLDDYDNCYHYIEIKKYSSKQDMRSALFYIVNDFFDEHLNESFRFYIDDKDLLLFFKEF